MQTGPSFKILPNCNECEFAKFNFSIGENETGKVICMESGSPLKIDNYRNSSLIQPHDNCPFIGKNIKEFHQNELKLIAEKKHKEKEDKLKLLIERIKLIWPNLYSIQYSNDLTKIYISDYEFNLGRLMEIRDEIPNNSFEINPCYIGNNSRIGIQLTIYLK